MDNLKLKEYKGYSIEVDPYGHFHSDEHQEETLAKLQEWIDKQARIRLNVPCLMEESHGYGKFHTLKQGRITSFKLGYNNAKEFRVSVGKESRYHDLKHILKPSKLNEEKFAEIQKFRKEISALSDKIDDLDVSMERFTEAEILAGVTNEQAQA